MAETQLKVLLDIFGQLLLQDVYFVLAGLALLGGLLGEVLLVLL